VIYLNAIHLWMQSKKCFSPRKRLNRVFVTAVIEIMPWILRSYSACESLPPRSGICALGCRSVGCWRSHLERSFRFPFCNLRVAAGRYLNTLED
jgi:hypothetical protein